MASAGEPQSGPAAGSRTIAEIPCFRSTFLYSIGAGLGVGLGTFMFTSRPRLASHVAFGTYCGVALSYWVYCRYTWNIASFQYRRLQHAARERAVMEGTKRDATGDANPSDARPEIADA